MVGSRMYVTRKIESGEYKFISHGFLYSTKTGILKVYEGDVYLVRSGHSRLSDRCIFVVDGLRHNICMEKPGEVYNCLVWLPERDDNKAIDILIKNEEFAIWKLHNEIEYHEKRIKMLDESKAE